jgi:hypothetical protein
MPEKLLLSARYVPSARAPSKNEHFDFAEHEHKHEHELVIAHNDRVTHNSLLDNKVIQRFAKERTSSICIQKSILSKN